MTFFELLIYLGLTVAHLTYLRQITFQLHPKHNFSLGLSLGWAVVFLGIIGLVKSLTLKIYTT